MDKNKSLLIYAASMIVVFYLIPLLFKGDIVALFLLNPLAVLIGSVIFSKKYSFSFLVVITSAVLFLPSIFMFYNESAWIYAVFYAMFSLVGSIICYALRQKR